MEENGYVNMGFTHHSFIDTATELVVEEINRYLKNR